MSVLSANIKSGAKPLSTCTVRQSTHIPSSYLAITNYSKTKTQRLLWTKSKTSTHTYPQTLATEDSGVSSVTIPTQPGAKDYPEPARVARMHFLGSGIARTEGSVLWGCISEQSWPYASFIGTVITRAGTTHGDTMCFQRGLSYAYLCPRSLSGPRTTERVRG